MRLSKNQIHRRTAEMRDLWNSWDPIGVRSVWEDWPLDEYDSYLHPTLSLLESGASLQLIDEYLSHVELNQMGLSETAKSRVARLRFAASLREWYERNWSRT
jgi:hypothetical protein